MTRVEYEMTEKQHAALLDACKPVPAMFGSGGIPLFGTPQENANRAWNALGRELGFRAETVESVPGKSDRFFTAEPTEIRVHHPDGPVAEMPSSLVVLSVECHRGDHNVCPHHVEDACECSCHSR